MTATQVATAVRSVFMRAGAGIRAKLDFDKNRAASLVLYGFTLIVVTGCVATPIKVVEVPVRQSCVTEVPAKPQRLTAKPRSVSRETWVQWLYSDIERLQSAVDQLTLDLEACK